MYQPNNRAAMFRKSQTVDKETLAHNNINSNNQRINPHVFIPKNNIWANKKESTVKEIYTSRIDD